MAQVSRRNADKFFGRLCAYIESDRIALEQQQLALLSDRVDQMWMAVAKRRNSVPAVQVENSPTIRRNDVAACRPFRDKRQLPVHAQHRGGFACARIGCGLH